MDIQSMYSFNLNSLMGMSNDGIAQQIQDLQQRASNYQDPSGVNLDTRYTTQISSTQQSNDNIDQGIALLNAGDDALSQIQNSLTSIRDLVVQANDPTKTPSDIYSLQQEINSQLDSVNSLINNTFYNGMKVFDTSGDNILSNTFSSSNNGVATPDSLYTDTNWSQTVSVTQLAQGMQVSGDAQTSETTALGYSGSFLVNGVTINVTDTMSLDNIRDTINLANTGVTASITNNQLVLTSNTTGVNSAITASDVKINSTPISNSTNTSVASIDTVTDTSDWSHTVDVTQMAANEQVRSDTQSSSTNALNLSGTFAINGVNFNVTDNMSLTDIQNLINGTSAGVTASISNNQLFITSNTTGASGAFSLSDLTNPNDSTTSSNQNVASITSLNSNTDWSHTVTVSNLAYSTEQAQSVDLNFKTDQTNQLTTISGNSGFSWTGSALQGTGAMISGDNAALVNGTSNWNSQGRSGAVSVATDWKASLYLNYKDSNNYVEAQVDTFGQNLFLTKVVNGVRSDQAVHVNTVSDRSVYYQLSASSDGNGNYNAILSDAGGVVLGNVNASGWTDADQLKGSMGVEANGRGQEPLLTDLHVYGTVTTNHVANYSVDGVNYTSSTNTINIGTGGTNDATIQLGGAGTTTVSNVHTNSVLQNLGIVNTITPSGATNTTSSVATVASINSNTDWSHSVVVTQTAGNTVTNNSINMNFSTNQTNQFASGSSTFTYNGSYISSTNTTSESRGYLNTTSWDSARTMSADVKTDNYGGVNLNYVDSNNYVAAEITTSGGEKFLNIKKMVNGVLSNQSVKYTFDPSKFYTVSITSDGKGNYTASAKDASTGNLVAQVSASGWTDATNMGGKMAVYGKTNGAGLSFDNITASGTTTTAHGAIYSVDGISYTSSTNTVNIGTSGSNDATINLKAVGTTTISSNKTTETAKNIVKNAQDTLYSVDGVNYSTSNNQVQLKSGTGNTQATIQLNGTGSTVVSTKTPKSIVLQQLGILNTSETFKNINNTGKDANYSINGTQYTSHTNQNLLLSSDGRTYGTFDIKGIGTTTIQNQVNTSSSNLTGLKLHSGWSENNKSIMGLTQISKALLGLEKLRTNLTNGTEMIDSANSIINVKRSFISGELGRLTSMESYNNTLLQQLTNNQTQIQQTMDAKLQSRQAKQQLVQQNASYVQSILLQQMNMNLSLLQNLLSKDPSTNTSGNSLF